MGNVPGKNRISSETLYIMKWKARSQPHRTSIRQEQKSQVVRGVHYSEDGVEDISLKRKKKAGRPNLATTQGDMLKKKQSEIKSQKNVRRENGQNMSQSVQKGCMLYSSRGPQRHVTS